MPEDGLSASESRAKWAGKPWVFALALLGLLGLAAGAIVWGSKPRLYVDPTAEGNADKHREIVALAKPAPEKQDDFYESLNLTRTNNRVRIEFPNSERQSSRLLDYQLHRLKAGESIQLPRGPLKLKYQSIGYGEFPADKLKEYSVRPEPRHFDVATGEELDEEAAKEQLPRYEGNLEFRGLFPTIKFFLTYDPSEEIKFIGYSLFDARTKASLSDGYSWGGSDGMAYVEMELKKWHAGPVELVVDLATSPVERIEVPPREGAVIQQPSWELHLAAVTEGDSRGSSSGSNGTNSYVQVNFTQDKKKDREKTTFMFVGNPWASHLPLDLDAIGKDGKKLNNAGGGSSSRYLNKSIRSALDEVDHLRATIYKDVRRLVYEIPAVHGLPVENDGLSNLFDAHIPYMRIKGKWEYRKAIESLTQLSFSGRAPVFERPASDFPIEYHNITPRELLEEYLAYGPGPQSVAIDPETHRFVLVPPPLERLRETFEKIFKK